MTIASLEPALERPPKPSRRAQFEAGLKALIKDKRLDAAERRFVRLAATAGLSDELFGQYVSRFVYRRVDRRLADILASPRITRSQRLMIEAFDFARRGMREEAGARIRELLRDNPDDREVWRARWFMTRYAGELDAAVHAGLRVIALSPRPDFLFARRAAMDADRIGEPTAFRTALKRAIRDAETALRTPTHFARQYVWLARFWLEMFELEKAQAVVEEAKRRELPLAADIAAEYGRLRAEFGVRRAEIEAARADVARKLAGGRETVDANAVEVVLSANFVSFKPADSPRMRAGLRFALNEIIAEIEAMKRPVRIRSKFDGQAPVQGGACRCLISYHTEGAPGETLHLKEGYHPGFVTLDDKGYSGWASIVGKPLDALPLDAIDTDRAEAHFLALRERFVAPNVSKYDQAPLGSEPPAPGGHVFVALQIVNDSVQALARVPMIGMIDEVTAAASERGLAVVVKRHPRCNSPEVAEKVRRGAEAGLLTESAASIHELIAGASAVCTVNSGVGLEALFHLKPVYLFGAADYAHVCRDVPGPGAFAGLFRGGEAIADDLTIKRYLCWLYDNHFIDCAMADEASSAIRARVREYVLRKRGEARPARKKLFGWF